jgi:dihydrofolate reductase
LKQQDGPVLLTQGSSGLLQTLLAHDLIDEFRLLTFPLVLGQGKRLFGQGAKPEALKLTANTISTTGVIMSVYERDGAIKTGTFELAQPSEAEIKRRERMKREG